MLCVEANMEKIDLKKTLKHVYNARTTPVFLEIPALKFLMADGQGNPNTSPEYAEVLQALYSVAYTLKFKVKKELNVNYGVMVLEGLWWTDNMADFSEARKNEWQWTMMILQPDFITPELMSAALAEAERKKALAALPRLRFETYTEGFSAQSLHLGPYATEAPTIQRLHEFIHTNGYVRSGTHHEIYLSDPRRGDPAKTKTIIRQPARHAV
jgi:hypothetical protein